MPRLGRFFALLTGCVLPIAAQTLDGVWRSEGYGYVFKINGQGLQAFEVTTRTCLASLTAKREDGSAPGREATFRTDDGDVYFVRTGGVADHKLLHGEGSASDIRIDRLPKMPAECDHPTGDTPIDNFEVFTRTWAENYISFDLKHADWDQIVSRNRLQVTPQTSSAALFKIFQGMIEPFGDAHTFIRAPKLKKRFDGIRSGTDRVVKDAVGDGGLEEFHKTGVAKVFAATDRAYLHGPLRDFCNHKVQFGRIDATTGYLRIVSFSGYSKEGGFAKGMAAIEAALDEIFSDSKLNGLVIDVRINFGGEDPYGLEIASRLASKDYLAYTKYARADARDRNKWTPGDASVVKPSSRPGFRGTVVELIGPFTISAGETFTQALMGRVPHVTRIGENTQGVFSDVLVRRLPNGWMFGLPNEVYRNREGTAFDGVGITPDISIPVFASADIASGKDPAMARALEIIRASAPAASR